MYICVKSLAMLVGGGGGAVEGRGGGGGGGAGGRGGEGWILVSLFLMPVCQRPRQQVFLFYDSIHCGVFIIKEWVSYERYSSTDQDSWCAKGCNHQT